MPTSTISKTELARQTREILHRVRKDSPLIVESYGQQEAALLDILDYRLLRAVASWSVCLSSLQMEDTGKTNTLKEPNEKRLAQLTEESCGDTQISWNMIIAAYLNEEISLGRAAQLLGLSRFELADRFQRLELPLVPAHRNKQEILDELEAFQK